MSRDGLKLGLRKGQRQGFRAALGLNEIRYCYPNMVNVAILFHPFQAPLPIINIELNYLCSFLVVETVQSLRASLGLYEPGLYLHAWSRVYYGRVICGFPGSPSCSFILRRDFLFICSVHATSKRQMCRMGEWNASCLDTQELTGSVWQKNYSVKSFYVLFFIYFFLSYVNFIV